MLMAKRASSTLGSANSSRIKIATILRKVAAVFIAATFLVLPRTAFAAGVVVRGLPSWQTAPAEQSLKAVDSGIASEIQGQSRNALIRTVAERLFTGYKIETHQNSGGRTVVEFKADGGDLWKVNLQAPQLRDEPLKWFDGDVIGMQAQIASLLDGVPLKSIGWSDRALQDEIEAITDKQLPGWKPSLIISQAKEDVVLSVSFLPQMPLVLAVNPILVSNSLPTLLHGEFKEGLMGEFAPFIGIPVAWAARHSKDMKRWAEDYIDGQRLSARSASQAEAEFVPSQVSKLNVRVESVYYTIGIWAAFYAGTSDKSAELGVHVGRKVPILPNFDIEAYGEGILGLQDWDINGRFGVRWRSIRDLWLGAEWDTKDSMWWGRLNMDPQLHKPYVWIRVREDGKVNGAIGWKATEYISFEGEYDARDEDRWSLKMLGNL